MTKCILYDIIVPQDKKEEYMFDIAKLNASQKLRIIRIVKGYSRQKFADELGISITTLSRYEHTNTNPRPLGVRKKIEELEKEIFGE